MTTTSLQQLKFNIAIVDDHDSVLLGVCSFLKKYFINVQISTFTEGAKLLEHIRTKPQDIFIVDLNLKDVEGLELIKIIRGIQSNAKIIVYSMHEGLWIIKSLLTLNIEGVVLKSSSLDFLKKAVEEVYIGGKFYCQRFKQISKDSDDKDSDSFLLVEAFNDIHLTIIKLTAQGYTSQEIATKTGHTKQTIMSYKKDLFRKLGVNSATELVGKAIIHGFINKKDILKKHE
ncbi:response regulator transcription factor [Bacteroides sp. 224]|uniref:response regulator transcription factor n=1 Tax=Bacteroides sp. 224 TaxID=2302936 RepID=UPI0013D51FDC|nr:response regulator transcription factor [Bacteroides sp. 224]NDV65270.1 DNA-binding response regulator [Bacteroides sp. 224]